MPAPAVYVLAVVSAVGAAAAFKHFVYDPHLAPMIEQWAEEYLAHRRAQRQQQSPISVPATIPLRRRRGDRSRPSDSNASSSDSDDNSHKNGSVNRINRKNDNPSSSATRIGDFNTDQTRDVNQWRSEVEQSQRASVSLRHRLNRAVRPTDQSINSIPSPTMSPTHVIFDSSTSAPTTPTATLASVMSSPPAQVSSIGTPQTIISESTARPQVIANNPTIGQSLVPESDRSRLTYPTSPPPMPNHHSPPPTVSSPIPSLSQSYPQELDREQGVELLSPPSSGTSSPFTTFSPLAVPQVLSPFAVVQTLDRDLDPTSEFDTWSHTPLRALSPSQHTNTSSQYQSFPTSPTPLRPSPLGVNDVQHTRSSSEELSQLSSPSPINFASPNPLSPRSPHSNLSDLESMTDLDVMSEFGSDGSDGSDGSGGSWAEVPSVSGSANRR